MGVVLGLVYKEWIKLMIGGHDNRRVGGGGEGNLINPFFFFFFFFPFFLFLLFACWMQIK